MKSKNVIFIFIVVMMLSSYAISKEAPQKNLIAIDIAWAQALKSNNMPYIWKSINYLIVEWNATQQNKMQSLVVPFQILATNIKDEQAFYIFELRDEQKVPAEWNSKILYRNGKDIIIEMEPDSLDQWVDKGYRAIRLSHKDYFIKDEANLIPFTCTYNATINDLLGRTNQNQWVDWIEKLSGVDTVVLASTTYTINRRQSSALFNGDIYAKAHDFLLWQGQQYHYGSNIEEDSYGSSGWKNLIFTIPGQTAPTEIVGISAHLDDAPGSGIAPGANDNGTGSAFLIEAARLLRQFRFQRTIKIMWFTGEEQGLLGSAAYVADHSGSTYLGVVNGDMFGYDPNGNRCFELHVGTLAASNDVGQCMNNTITAYTLNLPHDYLTTNGTNLSDHASFWNVNVGAVELLENFLTTGGTCGASEANPYYHTSGDTLANDVTLPFAYDIHKASLASIAAMAIPVSTCFSSVPTVTATAGVLQVALSWTAVTGASSYRVYRSTQSCYGQWFEQTSTTGTTWTDTSVTAGVTYYYYVEAVASDGFCTSNMSNCATAVPQAPLYWAAYRTNTNIIVGNPANGDGDAYPDNCETVTSQVTIENLGSLVATNTQVTITPVSNFMTVTTTMPINAGNIPVGGTANVQFVYTCGTGANQATCMQTGTFNIAVQAQGQTTPDQKTFGFMHEVDVTTGTKTWAFEPATGLEGWTVSSGTWALSSARVNTGGSTRSVHSSQTTNSACDIMSSPTILLAPAVSSTLTVPNWYATEQYTPWYDRANVHIIDVDAGNTRTLVSPASGKLYKTGTYSNDSACSMGTEAGWAGNATADMTWGNSVFNLGTTWAGKNIKIEVRYYTDTVTSLEGVYVDDITLTNVRTQACDVYSNTCPSSGHPGRVLNNLTVAKSGTNLNLAWTAPTLPCVPTGYGLYRGTLPWTAYNHASVNCSITTTTTSTPQDTGSYYYLIVPLTSTNEGSYGTASSGSQIPAGTTPCRTTQDTIVC